MKTILTGLFALFMGIVFGQSPVTEAEYFFNDDPGYGEATAISLIEGFDISISELITNELPLGVNTITLRPTNETGQWGMEQTISFLHYQESTTTPPVATVLVGYEYFFGDDPGFGEGLFVSVTEDAEAIIQEWFSTSGYSNGTYTLSMRPKGNNDIWGISDYVEFEYLACEEDQITIDGDDQFCEGSGVILTAPEGFDIYAWNTYESTQVITATEGGAFNVAVYDQENHQCFHSNTLDIEMIPTSDPTFEYEYSFNTVTFTATLPNQDVTWEINGNEEGTTDPFEFTFDTDGEHTVCLEVNNFCGTFETCETVLVCAEFLSPPFFYLDEDEDGFGNETDSLRACAAPVSYTALGGDCDDDNPDINPEATEIEGDNIDQNCDGLDITTGLIEMTEADFNVYPNPTNGILNVKFSQGFSGEVYIYNTQGKRVFQSEINDMTELQIDTDSFGSGFYIMRIFNQNQQALSRISVL